MPALIGLPCLAKNAQLGIHSATTAPRSLSLGHPNFLFFHLINRVHQSYSQRDTVNEIQSTRLSQHLERRLRKDFLDWLLSLAMVGRHHPLASPATSDLHADDGKL